MSSKQSNAFKSRRFIWLVISRYIVTISTIQTVCFDLIKQNYDQLYNTIYIIYFIIFAQHWESPGGRLNIRMSSYQYRDPHVKDKTVSLPSYLWHGNPHTWRRRSLYWIRAQVVEICPARSPIPGIHLNIALISKTLETPALSSLQTKQGVEVSSKEKKLCVDVIKLPNVIQTWSLYASLGPLYMSIYIIKSSRVGRQWLLLP